MTACARFAGRFEGGPMGSLGFAFVPAGALAAAFPGPRVLPLSRGTVGRFRAVSYRRCRPFSSLRRPPRGQHRKRRRNTRPTRCTLWNRTTFRNGRFRRFALAASNCRPGAPGGCCGTAGAPLRAGAGRAGPYAALARRILRGAVRPEASEPQRDGDSPALARQQRRDGQASCGTGWAIDDALFLDHGVDSGAYHDANAAK